jgi:GWxTD domain-containing protein
MKALALLFFFFTSTLFSQSDEELPRSAQMHLNPISFEAIPYWSEDTSSVELAVFYRIHPEFFFFAKAHNAQHEIYEAKGELIFEISDEKEATVTRESRPLQIERYSLPEEGIPSSEEIYGALTFKFKKGMYQIVVEAKDIESNKSFINRDTKIDARIYFSGLTLSTPIFVEPSLADTFSNRELKYFPLNRGGSVIIGQTGACLLQITSPDTNQDIHLSWKVNSKNETDEDNPVVLQGNSFIQNYGVPAISEHQKRACISIKKNSKFSRIVFIPVSLERLETGKYRLNIVVTQGSSKSAKDFFFNVIWPLKPHSLSDFKLAVDATRHIATEAELDSMTAFSTSKSMKAFRAFWHRRNPDTTNAFNPSMAEYYRRVDETIKRYSSANEIDGYRTDRGRIYILFGSPSFTNRLLRPNSAPTEIWTYEKLRRRFTFTDQHKAGNYILIKMENY